MRGRRSSDRTTTAKWSAQGITAQTFDSIAVSSFEVVGKSKARAPARSLDAYGPHPDHKPVAALVRGTFDRIVVFGWVL